MSASIFHLVALPIEILERTLLYLPSQDIIKMQLVNRLFQDLVRTLPALQHQCELFAIGLIENPCNSCDLHERRKLCGRYTRKWSNAYSGNGLFVTRHGSPAFLHVPPTASGKPVEDWSILLRPARISNRVAYPPENIIAVAEAREQTVHVHFFNLRDGSPHSSPTSNTITWELPPGSRLISARDMAITGSRIMMHYRLDEGQRSVWKIVVWNRKTGESVLDLSTVGNELVNKNTEAIFLDEFRVVIFDRWAITDSLVVFDTLVPQYHPQRLLFPLEFRNTSVGICVDHGRDLGTPDKDEVLLPDPAQAVLIIELGQDREHQMLLVVRTQILVNWVDSVRADYRVPWDEWGRDTVAIQVQNDGDHETFTFVRGAQVMIMRAPRGSGCYEVRTFDFSQRGRGSLPLRGGADGTGRTLFEDGINLRFEPGLFFGAFDALESFSDGSLIHLGEWRMGDTLRVWELC